MHSRTHITHTGRHSMAPVVSTPADTTAAATPARGAARAMFTQRQFAVADRARAMFVQSQYGAVTRRLAAQSS